MISIAICDDNSTDLQNIHNLAVAYAEQHNITNFEITKYKNVGKLLDTINSAKITFNLIFLDIIMPKTNGIQAGVAIKNISPQTDIIYLSTSDEFAIDSYSVSAFYYMLKPAQPDKFTHVMDLYMSKIGNQQNGYFSVKTHGGLVTCDFKSIEHGHLHNRQSHFYLTDGSVVISTTIRGLYTSYLAELLNNDCFAMSSATDLINLIHVEKLSPDKIMLKNSKKVVLLSRPHKKGFQEKFFNLYSK